MPQYTLPSPSRVQRHADMGWLPAAEAALDRALHLGEALLLVRERLNVGTEMSDRTILDCLHAVTAGRSPRERWLAAFNSTLGHWLALRGTDLNTALSTVVALAPPPVS